MEPRDDHTQEFATFSDGTLRCSRRSILHVEFFVELLPDSAFQFMLLDSPRNWRFTQFIAVDIDLADHWQEIRLTDQPRHIQRHMSVISQPVESSSRFNAFTWRPDGVVSNKNITLMTDA